MYGSIRIYLDDFPKQNIQQSILSFFEFVSSELNISYNYIEYLLFNPDYDDKAFHKIYKYDENGKTKFLNTEFLTKLIGLDGEESSPFISAKCHCEENELISKGRVEIQFPCGIMPLTIRIDFKIDSQSFMSNEKYRDLLFFLQLRGFKINNAYYNVFSVMKEVGVLDGLAPGGVLGVVNHKYIKASVEHRKNGCRNSLMSVFCANTVSLDLLTTETVRKIENVVEKKNTFVVDNLFSFVVGDLKTVAPLYKVKYVRKIKELEKLLM